ncbi:NAD(P)-dependent oxidoreductase [Virgibacillus pantothenticus]|uniref:Oxidoreductase n=1 Tax=Virgibacillus pantothenticus TaxID=1473 RepID=A0A0L0QTW0_VIRPA|nr:oxidoreductase [Virgibacillus sp. 6R]KNE21643.1 oxidoreductase [Virgibacillus pantothenticus]MBS7427823.1 NAD(P)-dependent oxidoreductase [Virgibacillus sp. 19R1-5]MBU8568626.1 NAD(P)-dependent oxidoreductase [Virgibacillus pantothenticus]MBU8602630.1 NAD(P)-dependent oxidoreductase [Virgibacillus pantothenticus]
MNIIYKFKRGECYLLTKDARIGFIGTGVMGSSMAKRIMHAGYSVSIYTRTKQKAEALISAGADWEDSIADLAKKCTVIITMVGYPSDVEEVYFSDQGILKNASKGSYFIDMTTSKPKLAIQIAKEAEKKGCLALDAPVSGGDIGAKNGKLTIMVGGQEQAFHDVLELFQTMGDNIILQGEAGAGQHTKLANQITIASNMIGVCEAIAYAKKTGLDPERVLDSITAGAAGSWSLSNLAPRMIKGDYAPGFYVKHFIKDMKIALESAEELGLSTPGLALSLRLYQELEANGEADSGTQALIKLISTQQ